MMVRLWLLGGRVERARRPQESTTVPVYCYIRIPREETGEGGELPKGGRY